MTNADSTFKTTLYEDALNRITVTDENGVSHRYEFTPLGKIAKDYILAPDTLLSEFRYDHYDMVLTKRTTGAGLFSALDAPGLPPLRGDYA